MVSKRYNTYSKSHLDSLLKKTSNFQAYVKEIRDRETAEAQSICRGSNKLSPKAFEKLCFCISNGASKARSTAALDPSLSSHENFNSFRKSIRDKETAEAQSLCAARSPISFKNYLKLRSCVGSKTNAENNTYSKSKLDSVLRTKGNYTALFRAIRDKETAEARQVCKGAVQRLSPAAKNSIGHVITNPCVVPKSSLYSKRNLDLLLKNRENYAALLNAIRDKETAEARKVCKGAVKGVSPDAIARLENCFTFLRKSDGYSKRKLDSVLKNRENYVALLKAIRDKETAEARQVCEGVAARLSPKSFEAISACIDNIHKQNCAVRDYPNAFEAGTLTENMAFLVEAGFTDIDNNIKCLINTRNNLHVTIKLLLGY